MTVDVKAISPMAMTVKDAVKFSGISRTVLYELIRDGKLRAKKLNQHRLILVDSLREFISNLPSN